jgi:hypothetical protein
VVIETLTFRTAPGTDDADFLAADRRVQTEVMYHQPGFLRRTTARNADGDWLVIMLWQDAASADAAALLDAAVTGLADPATVDRRRYTTLD